MWPASLTESLQKMKSMRKRISKQYREFIMGKTLRTVALKFSLFKVEKYMEFFSSVKTIET